MSGENIANNVTSRNDWSENGQEGAQAAAKLEKDGLGEPVKQRKNSPLLITGGAIVLVTLAVVALITEYF